MIQLQTLGAVNLRRDGVEVRSVLSQPKRLALLVYLATARPRGYQSRDRLLALFWPDSDDTRARNALRQAIHQLRTSLGRDVVVGRGDREIGIDAEKLWCDAVAVDRALEDGNAGNAIDLYRGDFMPAFYVDGAPDVESFLEEERLRLRRGVKVAAWAIADEQEAGGDARAAAESGRRALGLDAMDESSLRRLIGLLERSGQRAAALQLFDDFARRLEAEYGLPPSPESVAVIEQLRSRAKESVRQFVQAPRAPPVRADNVPRRVATAGAHPSAGDPVSYNAIFGSDSRSPGAGADEGGAAAATVATAKRSRRRGIHVTALVTVLLAVIGTAGTVRQRMIESRAGTRAAAAPDGLDPYARSAVAVLPFVNMSGDPDNEFFSDGIAEEVAYALSRVPGLRVVGRTSAFSFKGSNIGVDSIGRALRVAYVVEGSVRVTGGRMRIIAQLIDAASGYHVWSDTWDGEMRDLFSVQAEISRAVAAEIQPRLAGSVAQTVESRPETPSAEAYEAVLRGYQAMLANEFEVFERADSLFARAIALDPGYARAHAGMAAVYMVNAFRGLLPRDQAYDMAIVSARRALQLDPDLAVAHSVMARILEDGSWDFPKADEYYRRAIQLSPGSEIGYRHRGLLMSLLGRHDEAIALGRRAVEIDPLATGSHFHLAVILDRARRYDEAIASYRIALAIAPDNSVVLSNQANALTMAGRHEEAVAAASRAIARSPDELIIQAHAAWVQAREGDTAAARAALARIEAAPRPSAYLRAMLLMGLGDHERALACLEEALTARDPLMKELGVAPAFDPIRGDPRMDALVRRVGLLNRG